MFSDVYDDGGIRLKVGGDEDAKRRGLTRHVLVTPVKISWQSLSTKKVRRPVRKKSVSRQAQLEHRTFARSTVASPSTTLRLHPAKDDDMAPRASSPALSENDFDISNALFGGGDIDARQNNGLDGDLGVDLDIGGDDGSDDEAFIAAQQAASNRKASNLKGKTVKKGGGFQAMGLNAALLKAITRKGFSVPTPIQYVLPRRQPMSSH